MRPAIITLAVALTAALLAVPAFAQIIELDKESVDLGNMNQFESRDIQVTVTNKGGALLEISEVKADCGCTVPTLNQKMLLPGESTVIDINFNSKQFNGHVQKMVTIYSNDPDRPQAVFGLTATIFAPLLIDPETRRVGFSQSPVGQEVTQRVTFTATKAPDLQIQARKSRKGLFNVSVENHIDGNPQQSALVVTIPATLEPGRHRDNVRVKTNLPEKEYVDIDISAWITQALKTSLDQINFRYKKDLSKTIHVMPQEGTKMTFNVTKVECDLPEIDIKVEVPLPNEQTTIRLSGQAIGKDDPRAQKARGRIKGTLIIHTDLKDLPTLEVPISYMVRM